MGKIGKTILIVIALVVVLYCGYRVVKHFARVYSPVTAVVTSKPTTTMKPVVTIKPSTTPKAVKK
jgi:hypothetical protein